MKKFVIIVVILAVGVFAYDSFSTTSRPKNNSPAPFATTPPADSPTEENFLPVSTESIDLSPQSESGTASFAIYTNNTFRIFTAEMYHFQSSDVFISPDNPNLVHFTRTVSWEEFFETLPFSVSQTCLITGTKQEFCNTDTSKLFFYINGKETPNALSQTINPQDSLLITYGNSERIDLDLQLTRSSFLNTSQPDN